MNCEEYQNLYKKYNTFPLSREILETNEYEEYEDHSIECESCLTWILERRLITRGIELNKHCCLRMTYEIAEGTKEGIDPYEDSDVVMVYSERFDEYGIPVQDGGSSFIIINYCPWCGRKLPDSKRYKWFDELVSLGYSSPFEDDIPTIYKTGEWYKK